MQLQNVILLMGPPGCGKGTQSKLLVEKLGYAYFSMGDYFRQVALENPNIKAIIDKGIIVPDADTEAIFRQGIEPAISGKAGLVLDGFPRTLGQIGMLDRFLADSGSPKANYFFIDVDKEKLLNRLSLRSKQSGRADDSDVAIMEKRFDEYTTKTKPVRSELEARGLLVHMNGDQSIEAVHQTILDKLGLK